MEIDTHIGCAMSGLTADARTMVDHARVTGQMHNFTYDEKIGIESCTQAVCDLALRFGESVEDDDALMVSPVRPFARSSRSHDKGERATKQQRTNRDSTDELSRDHSVSHC